MPEVRIHASRSTSSTALPDGARGHRAVPGTTVDRHIREAAYQHRLRLGCAIGSYGALGELDRMVSEADVDAVLHGGNFGFFDANSHRRLTTIQKRALWEGQRQLQLRRDRSHWLPSQARNLDDMRAHFDEQYSRQPMSALGSYGPIPAGASAPATPAAAAFKVPVVAVWGREDMAVINAFRTGQLRVPNLHVVSSNDPVVLKLPVESAGAAGDCLKVYVWGVGGEDWYDRLFHLGEGSELLSGHAGVTWYNVLQLGAMLEAHERLKASDPQYNRPPSSRVSILLTHASAGHDPILYLLAKEMQVSVAVGGGLRPPWPSVFNALAMHNGGSLATWLGGVAERFEEVCRRVVLDAANTVTERERQLTQLVLGAVKRQSAAILAAEEGKGEGRDGHLRTPHVIGLPELCMGYAVLNIDVLQTSRHPERLDVYVGVEARSRGHLLDCAVSRSDDASYQPVPVDRPPAEQSFVVPPPTAAIPTVPTASTPSAASPSAIRLSDMAETNYSGSALFVVRNVPGGYFESEQHFYREMLHGKYEIKSLRFYSQNYRDSLRGECVDETTAIRLVQEMDGLVHVPSGHRLQCSRMGSGANIGPQSIN